MKRTVYLLLMIVGAILFSGCSMEAETLDGLEHQLSEMITDMPEDAEDNLQSELPPPTSSPAPTVTETPTISPTPTPSPTPTLKPTLVYELEQLGELSKDTVRKGCYVTFGSYEQDDNFVNGAEPIEWLVLDVVDGRAMLLSRYGLDFLLFHDEYTSVLWENSNARAWLNNVFFYNAFDAGERSCVEETTVDNSGDKIFRLAAGNDTSDKVFLLSVAELKKYFPDKAVNNGNEDAFWLRTTTATEYAQEQTDLHRERNVMGTVEDQYTCAVWLRDVVLNSEKAVIVEDNGKINYSGHIVNSGVYGRGATTTYQYMTTARPAIWVDLEKLDSAEEVLTESVVINAEDVSAGEYITFGHYEQDNIRNNGTEEIEWLVLDVQDDKALLLSKYVIDTRAFFASSGETNWEDCSLRRWMNEVLYYTAFSEAERNEVIPSTLSNDTDWQGNPCDGNTTQDKVFCLSAMELEQYLPIGTDGRGTIATEYAMDLGIGTLIYHYYMRSVDVENGCAIRVFESGAIQEAMPVGVRPAIWVKLH